MIIVLLFLPLAGFVALFWRSSRFPLRAEPLWTPAAAGAAVAIIASAIVLAAAYRGEWPRLIQVAWTGLEALQPNSGLDIGGQPENAYVGWPTGAFSPQMRISHVNDSEALVTTSRGGGFVQIEGEFINGEDLPLATSVRVDAYSLRVEPPHGLLEQSAAVVISDGGGEVARFATRPMEPARVYSISDLIHSGAERLRLRQRAHDAASLERWAADTWIAARPSGNWRFLRISDSHERTVTLPAHIRVLWPNRAQLCELRRNAEGSLELNFAAPWVTTTPLPPDATSKEARFVITGRPVPGDIAFVFPFGNAVPHKQGSYSFSVDSETEPHSVLAGHEGRAPSGLISQLFIPLHDRRAIPRFRLHVAAISDFPGARSIAVAALPCLVTFLVSLAVAIIIAPALLGYSMRKLNAWTTAGFGAAVWTLCLVRVLLAYRYALDPGTVDRLSLGGVVWAVLALGLLPSGVLLTATFAHARALEDDQARARGILAGFCHMAIVLVGAYISTSMLHSLWPNLQRWVPAFQWLIWLLGALLVYVIIMDCADRFAWDLILTRAAKRRGVLAVLIRWAGRLISLFRFPITLYQLLRQTPVWRALGSAGEEAIVRRQPVGLAIILYLSMLAPITLLLVLAFGGGKVAQEILAPTAVYLVAVWIWLESRLHFRPGAKLWRDFRWGSAIFLGTLLVLGPFAFPFITADPGGMVACLSLFTPLAALLLAGGKPRRIAAILSAMLVVTWGAATLLYVYPEPLLPVLRANKPLARITARYVAAHEGPVSRAALPLAQVVPDDTRDKLGVTTLHNAIEHSWETRAIASQGKYWGAGFGSAPVRNSSVRQDTLQFDSVYSFFILSEHGAIGGIALLLIYAVPLALVLISARDFFDIGHAFAAVLAASFWMEAIFHAAMNVAIPATGRNLPLLGVNSRSDLSYWSIVFLLMCWQVFRRNGPKAEYRDFDSVVTPVAKLVDSGPGVYLDRRHFEPQGLYVWKIMAISAVPVVGTIFVAVAGLSLAWSQHEYSNSQPWRFLQKEVRRRFSEIQLNPSDATIKFDYPGADVAGSLMSVEKDRFNQLSDAEKREGSLSHLPGDLIQTIQSGRFDAALEQMRQSDLMTETRPHPHLFEFRLESKTDEEDERLEVETSFNRMTRFVVANSREQLPTVTWQREPHRLLIGPAWQRGYWRLTFDPEPSLPWVMEMAADLENYAKDASITEANRRLSAISLDRELQLAAQAFTAQRARELHQSLLSYLGPYGDPNHPRPPNPQQAALRLPPRTALAVLRIPSGEVVALGGWPRMTSERFWETESGGLVPPARWAEQEAPASLRRRYAGDRNFDLLSVGSATKPIWASAVLSLHPNLHRFLYVKGEDKEETEAFGITIRPQKAWHVVSRGWIGFADYLKYSDNRYQVRLGFLGLAEHDANALGEIGTEGGNSPSKNESLDEHQRTLWGKYPKFEGVDFGVGNPGRIANVHNTKLAQALHKMFGIATVAGEGSVERSFWLGDEDKTLPGSGDFDGIAPETPDFALDKLHDPRAYLSLLLGGGANRWANVDLAAAFATCVTGKPVMARVVHRRDPLKPAADRSEFLETARKLRPGLQRVLQPGGTGAVLQVPLRGFPGFEAYAKTGTLDERPPGLGEKQRRYTSRILLALVKWNQNGTAARNGIVLSLVAERAEEGTAARWMAGFLTANRALLLRLLNEP